MNRNHRPYTLSGKLSAWLAIVALAALLTACAAPAAPTGSQPAATTAPTEAPAATEAPTEAPAATEAPTEAPAATEAPTEAPAATEAPTEAPAEAPAAVSDTPVSFSGDVMPIFQASCIKCHGGEDGEKGDLDLRTHEDVMKGGESGAVVVAGDAANSLLVKLITEGKMPKRGDKLTQDQVDLIARWVNEGAQNN
jgi:mono/diheme cytochrome c family protein